jgi:pyruvate dehydrogenase E1 component alpha subunit/2-oxoisovalerate dehydrogenase E1 component alpha subunit
VEKLPHVVIVADNQYAYSTPTSRQFACKNLTDRAAGYGVAQHEVDGTNLADCLKTVGDAVESARSGRGPQLVVARLLRLCGHGEHDDSNYIDPKLKNSPLGRDCIKAAEKELLDKKWADKPTIDTWRSEAIHQVEEAVATVQHEPSPDPFSETWCALSTAHLIEGQE